MRQKIKVNTKNHIFRALFLFMKLVINVGLFRKPLCGLFVCTKAHLLNMDILFLRTQCYFYFPRITPVTSI